MDFIQFTNKRTKPCITTHFTTWLTQKEGGKSCCAKSSKIGLKTELPYLEKKKKCSNFLRKFNMIVIRFRKWKKWPKSTPNKYLSRKNPSPNSQAIKKDLVSYNSRKKSWMTWIALCCKRHFQYSMFLNIEK